MQHPDVLLELSALWRRVALLEEDNRQKSGQIAALLQRMDYCESRLNEFVSPSTDPIAGPNLVPDVRIDIKPVISSEPVLQSSPVEFVIGSVAERPASSRQAPSSGDVVLSLASAASSFAAIDTAPTEPRPTNEYAADVGVQDFAPLLNLDSADDELPDREAIALMNSGAATQNEDPPAATAANDIAQTDLIRDLALQPILDSLPAFLSANLYLHQQVGTAFLSSVLKQNTGTIFADALGLGKTLQVSESWPFLASPSS